MFNNNNRDAYGRIMEIIDGDYNNDFRVATSSTDDESIGSRTEIIESESRLEQPQSQEPKLSDEINTYVLMRLISKIAPLTEFITYLSQDKNLEGNIIDKYLIFVRERMEREFISKPQYIDKLFNIVSKEMREEEGYNKQNKRFSLNEIFYIISYSKQSFIKHFLEVAELLRVSTITDERMDTLIRDIYTLINETSKGLQIPEHIQISALSTFVKGIYDVMYREDV